MKADRHRRFGDLADDIAARLPDREGLVFGASRYTFREVAARIDEAARRLIAAGVRPGEHVALWLNNSDEWIFISFAVQKIGAVLVPINTRFRSRDLSYVLAQSDSCFLITHDRSGPVDYAAMVREAVSLPASGATVRDPRYPLLRRVILLGQSPQAGTVDWASLAEPARHHLRRSSGRLRPRCRPRRDGLHHVHVGHDRVSQGRGADARADPQCRGTRLPDGHHAERHDPELPAALPRLRPVGGSVDVVGHRRAADRDPQLRSRGESRSDRERARDDHPRLRGAHEGPQPRRRRRVRAISRACARGSSRPAC